MPGRLEWTRMGHAHSHFGWVSSERFYVLLHPSKRLALCGECEVVRDLSGHCCEAGMTLTILKPKIAQSGGLDFSTTQESEC